MSLSAGPVDIGQLIVRTPGIKGGTPHIAGTGVTVRTVVRCYQLGLTPEEIAAEYPQTGLDKIYTALAYYHANRASLDTEFDAEEAESDRLEATHTNRPHP